MKPPEILLGRIKIFQCFRKNFTQKYPNRDIISSITLLSKLTTTHSRFVFFIDLKLLFIN